MLKDPVCGMQVDEKQAAAHEQYEGTTWYFCSEGCRKRFLEDPAKYVAQARAQPS